MAQTKKKEAVSPYVDKVVAGEKYVVRERRVIHYPPGVAGPYTGMVAKWMRHGEGVVPQHPLEVACLDAQKTKIMRVAEFPKGCRDVKSRKHHRQFHGMMRAYDLEMAGKSPASVAEITAAAGGGEGIADLAPAEKPAESVASQDE